MPEVRHAYRGHSIALRTAPSTVPPPDVALDTDAQVELLIDDKPVEHGQLPDGQYFLNDYAYDWRSDLVSLGQALIDHRLRAAETRPHEDAGDRDVQSGREA